MNSKVQVLFEPNSSQEKPWRFSKVIASAGGCGILTAEIAVPFGESLTDNQVEEWANDHAPQFLERHGTILRYRVLVSRNAPEGTRHRILLVSAPERPGEQPLADLLLPTEFALLALAEMEATTRGGNFLYTLQHHGNWHWFIYRDGLLSFWGMETLSMSDTEAWYRDRLEQIQVFATADPQFDRTEKIEHIEGSVPSDLSTPLVSLCEWDWVQAMNLQLPMERNVLESYRDKRRSLFFSIAALLIVLVVSGVLFVQKKSAQTQIDALKASAGEALSLQVRESEALDSLRMDVQLLQAQGLTLQTAPGIRKTLQKIYEVLPEGARLENLTLENSGLDGFRYFLQFHTEDWDDAELLVRQLKQQTVWRSVNLESNRPAGQNGIQVRVAVSR